MNSPIISIIIPVYNAQEFLAETIASIQAQTFENFEVICVNDGSTDGSVTILEQTAHQDPRFRIVHQENAGAGAARNYGFAHAKGEYCIFLDSDDLFSEQLLEKLYHAITEHQADVAACNFSRIHPDGRETQHEGVHTKWIPGGLQVFSYRDTPDYILRVIDPVAWNKLYRTDFVREKGLKYEELSTVNELTFAALSVACAESITYIPDFLIRTRICDSSENEGTEDLDNIRKAVFSTVRQASELPHARVINRAILSFAVDHFVKTLANDIKNFSDPKAEAFYRMVYETFNSPEYAEVDAVTLRNPRRYLEFCSIKKHDYASMKEMVSRRLVVSLTTYPRRIGSIPAVLESIYNQTRKPDEVVLWLAEAQFPGKENELPEELLKWMEDGLLSVRWCDDLKPHKKYFYALQEYTDDLVVTVDDDLLYSRDMLASLYASYLLYPEAVSTVRAHLMMLDEQNRIMPYNTWIQETDRCIHKPSMQLMATGGAGVLYPPNLFRKEFFDKGAIMENCPWADDLWLKAMQVVSGVSVVVARPHEQLQYLPGTQEEALHQVNVRQNQNDVQLANISRWLDEVFEPGILIRKLTEASEGERILGMQAVSHHLDEERKALRRQVEPSQRKAKDAEAKQRQAENKQKQAENRRKQVEEKLKNTNEQLCQTQNLQKQTQQKLSQTEGKLSRTEDALNQTKQKLSQTEGTLNQTRQKLSQTEGTLNQTRQKLQQTEKTLNQTQQKLQRTELALRKTQENLARTNEQLRWTREHMPIGVQMRDLGEFLRQKRAGTNPLFWSIKYGIYLCGWIPLKLLTGTMYFLKNGFKATAKRIIGKLFRRGQ